MNKKTILSPIEKELLKYLDNRKSIEELTKELGVSSYKIDKVRSGLERLVAKGLINKIEEIKEVVELTPLGEKYKKEGLPEMKLLEILKKRGSISIKELSTILKKEEISGAIGSLKAKAVIEINKGNIVLIRSIDSLPEQKLLLKLPLELKDIKDLDKLALDSLLKRGKMVTIKKYKETFYEPAFSDFDEIRNMILQDEDYEEMLTPSMILDGSWKNKRFRPYEVRSPVRPIDYGMKHIVSSTIERIRRVWLSMGFEEMVGNIIQPEFWNFDALFVPQDHPAREMQDTFFLEERADREELPKRIYNKVKKAHYSGVKGSKGYGTLLMKNVSRRLVLRTHTTVLSARYLSKGEGKYFAIGKVYRNEALDWKHLFELHQVEGIVVGKNVNFRHLLFYLKRFYKKLGFSDVKIKPSYFPYTEPSAEVFAYNKEKGEWVEMGGSGILRQEVVYPLTNKNLKVLAWGLGLERLIMMGIGIKDIRELYRNDLKLMKSLYFRGVGNWL